SSAVVARQKACVSEYRACSVQPDHCAADDARIVAAVAICALRACSHVLCSPTTVLASSRRLMVSAAAVPPEDVRELTNARASRLSRITALDRPGSATFSSRAASLNSSAVTPSRETSLSEHRRTRRATKLCASRNDRLLLCTIRSARLVAVDQLDSAARAIRFSCTVKLSIIPVIRSRQPFVSANALSSNGSSRITTSPVPSARKVANAVVSQVVAPPAANFTTSSPAGFFFWGKIELVPQNASAVSTNASLCAGHRVRSVARSLRVDITNERAEATYTG